MADRDRPAILVVDDDPEVLRSVERDVRRNYSATYRVMPVSSGAEALSAIDRLTVRGDQIALVLADQRMPSMSGTELLEEVDRRVPGARRVLLTAYADTEAAIAAINHARVDYYILKPWEPPEERLYPVLDELLEEWQAVGRRTVEAGLRLVGDRWSAESYELREFLARNHVPFRWLEVGRNEEADRLVESIPEARLPVLVTADGTTLVAPSNDEAARAVGVSRTADSEFYDLVVIGAGPAGLAAAVYGASEGLSTAVVEATAPGGQAGTSARIENYLGFDQGISGELLALRAHNQARRFGAHFITPRRVVRLDRQDPYRVVGLDDGSELRCSAAIVATGVEYLELDVPGAADLRGRGLYYGATPTGFEGLDGEPVVVVGGANSAGQAAVRLARAGARVTMLVRAASLASRMSSYLVEQIEASPAIAVRTGVQVCEVHGSERVEGVSTTSPSGIARLEARAVFVYIGARPHTAWLEGVVTRDEGGFVVSGPALASMRRWGLDRDPMLLETSMPGVFAVGDVRSQSVKRVASAVGEGSVAVHLVHAYLSS